MRAIKITEMKTDGVYVHIFFYHNRNWYCIEEVYGGFFGYNDELLKGIPTEVIRNYIANVDNDTIFKEFVILQKEMLGYRHNGQNKRKVR